MGVLDAISATREAMKVCEEAEDMIAAGAVGEILEDSLDHAKELLDYADEEVSEADSSLYQVSAAAIATLRAKLAVLRDRAHSGRLS